MPLIDLLPLAEAAADVAMKAPDGGVYLSWGLIVSALTVIAGGFGTAIKAVWTYLTDREKSRVERYKAILDAKDKTIGEERAKVEEMGKALSKKSDEHAAKIQELMTLTLTKVEEMGGKTEVLLDRALTIMATFTAEMKKLAPSGPPSSGA